LKFPASCASRQRRRAARFSRDEKNGTILVATGTDRRALIALRGKTTACFPRRTPWLMLCAGRRGIASA